MRGWRAWPAGEISAPRLPRKGWRNTRIGQFVGHHRDTIAKAPREPPGKESALFAESRRRLLARESADALYPVLREAARRAFDLLEAGSGAYCPGWG